MPIGYSSIAAEPKSRRPLDTMVHYERYDRTKLRTVEYIMQFVEEDSILSKSYNRSGERKAVPEK